MSIKKELIRDHPKFYFNKLFRDDQKPEIKEALETFNKERLEYNAKCINGSPGKMALETLMPGFHVKPWDVIGERLLLIAVMEKSIEPDEAIELCDSFSNIFKELNKGDTPNLKEIIPPLTKLQEFVKENPFIEPTTEKGENPKSLTQSVTENADFSGFGDFAFTAGFIGMAGGFSGDADISGGDELAALLIGVILLLVAVVVTIAVICIAADLTVFTAKLMVDAYDSQYGTDSKIDLANAISHLNKDIEEITNEIDDAKVKAEHLLDSEESSPKMG